MAIASRLGSEIRGTNQAIRNAQDAQGLINTAEGAHKEVENILQRMREVAVQAANDSNGTSDRSALQAEMTQLTEEINRIAATTTWAGISLLNGGAAAGTTGTVDQTQTFKFQIATNTAGAGDTLPVSIKDISALSLGIGGTATTPAVAVTNVTAPASGAGTAFNAVASSGTITFTAATTAATAANQAKFTFTVAGGEQFTFDAFTHGTQKGFADTNNGMASAFVQFVKDQPGLAGVTGTPSTNTVALTKANSVSVASNSAAQTAINNIDGAISELNEQRASLGAYSNRLDSTVSNLTNVAIQLEGGKGRIEDADFAAESTNLAKSQILQQASTAMLAQANASKQSVLSLLQG